MLGVLCIGLLYVWGSFVTQPAGFVTGAVGAHDGEPGEAQAALLLPAMGGVAIAATIGAPDASQGRFRAFAVRAATGSGQ